MQIRRRDRFPIEITYIPDGDGFNARVLGGSGQTFSNVRLFAIDAPELAQKYGEQSGNYLRSLTRNGRFFMEIVEEDRYRRLVAIVYKDGIDATNTLNYIMVREGWAYWYSDFDPEDRLGIRDAEAQAYMEGKGVWREPDLERPWDYKDRIRREEAERTRRLIQTLASGHPDDAMAIIADGIDTATRDEHGRTPLHPAAEHGHTEIVQYLISRGADPNARDDMGQTPLYVAAGFGHTEIVQFLISKGANTKEISDGGWTPLHPAAQDGHTEVVNALIFAGADINSREHRRLDSTSPSRSIRTYRNRQCPYHRRR